MFFPTYYVLDSIQDPNRKRLTLELFVTIEDYLSEVEKSLQLLEKYINDHDQYREKMIESEESTEVFQKNRS